MSFNRLGTLCSGVFGIGWLIAIGVNLIFWAPDLLGVDPAFYNDSRQYLIFVFENPVSWRLFHIGATSGLLALIVLVPLLSDLRRPDERYSALLVVGLLGAAAGMLASLIDHVGTPVLAQMANGGSQTAQQVWEYVEQWRDNGLKTISFGALGIWSVWLATLWLAGGSRRLGIFTRVMGIGLILLAIVELFGWHVAGETGFGAIIFFFFPVWGLWVATWFWQRELASVLGSEAADGAG